ncbi:MAG: putative glutamine transport system substrate-binding protein [Glaciihabitans sp.]|jgi:polar amino acid transport system substrate-binding protein|nr:putative glutamine transport system substrate-binding protein [Glaciihabitans sp.]MDQ1572424.1 polar amino acid transport system substrate-binding protein [Actinomycetota bacterium]
MKSLKRIAVLVAAVAVVAGISACSTSASTPSSSTDGKLAAGTVVKVGAAAGPPFMILDSSTGQWTSFSADLARKFGTYAHVKIQFVPTSFTTIIAGLQSNKYDMIQPINATPERKQAVDFTSGVSAAGAMFFVPAGSKFKTLADLNKPSVTIATITGSAEETVTKQLLPKATLRSLPNASVATLATEVTAGRSDVMVDSSYLAPAVKNAFSLDSIPSYASTPNGLDPVQIGFSVRKGDTALLNALNKFIAAEKANGDLQKLADSTLTVANSLKG